MHLVAITLGPTCWRQNCRVDTQAASSSGVLGGFGAPPFGVFAPGGSFTSDEHAESAPPSAASNTSRFQPLRAAFVTSRKARRPRTVHTCDPRFMQGAGTKSTKQANSVATNQREISGLTA